MTLQPSTGPRLTDWKPLIYRSSIPTEAFVVSVKHVRQMHDRFHFLSYPSSSHHLTLTHYVQSKRRPLTSQELITIHTANNSITLNSSRTRLLKATVTLSNRQRKKTACTWVANTSDYCVGEGVNMHRQWVTINP
jgi:hypothetical protein